MNEASENDPFNNNCYGTTIDRPYKKVDLPVLDVARLQRADHPRLRGRLRREGPARRPLARPVADPRRHRLAARLQLHLPRDPQVHPRELHRLHGLRHRVPGHRHPRQGSGRGRMGAETADHSRGRPRHVPRAVVARPRSTTMPARRKRRRRRHVPDHHRPVEVQGLRGVRHRLRRQRPEDGRQDRRRDDSRPARAIGTSRTWARATRSTSAATCSST